jgi:hypothetical protein
MTRDDPAFPDFRGSIASAESQAGMSIMAVGLTVCEEAFELMNACPDVTVFPAESLDVAGCLSRIIHE